MKVLFVVNLASEYGGNIMACIKGVSRRLKQSGAEVYYLFPYEASGRAWLSDLDQESVSFADFGRFSLFNELIIQRKKLGRKTIVHAHFLITIQIATIRLLFPKVVNHFHMTASTLPASVSWKEVFRRIVYRSVTTVAVSPAVASDLRERFSLNSGQCVCILNAVDFSASRMKNRIGCSRVAAMRGAARGIFLVGMFGTHYECKGVDIAALALNELGGSYKLEVLSHDVEATRKKLDKLCLEDAYIEVRPVVEDVGSFYGSIDLFISPSRAEAFCYAIVEAAWSGCQVAASLVPGQDCLKAIPGSIWFEPENPMALAEAIAAAQLSQMRGELHETACKQRAFVERTYSLETWIKQIIALYDEIGGEGMQGAFSE
ncbi:glycosyltransferase family 4 protein [Gordonibacter pamelaeae]|uniref:glycosyltransferase family 4 protein n=1 Tax=Gordonibacter pamelaeae TaxID=471189 RepID=UPI00242E7CF3|nr:glycosyltransferase family 4 protein [Gordonibacter pamelaeae]